MRRFQIQHHLTATSFVLLHLSKSSHSKQQYLRLHTPTNNSDYGGNTTDRRWSHTNLNGLIVATNGYDAPQMWPLSGGAPSLSSAFMELRNWPSGNKCKVIRSFRTFLVGLNWSRTNEEPRLVKWSTEASFGSPPSTWSDSDNTLDAGSYSLSDTPGVILVNQK